MSYFQQKSVETIIKSCNLKESDYNEEFKLGRFISGYKQDVNASNPNIGIRKADLYIHKNVIYGVSRGIIIEIDGSQHDDPKASFFNATAQYTRAQLFNDQVARDKWEALQCEEKQRILIRIKAPKYNPDATNLYDKQLTELFNKLDKPGYFTDLIRYIELHHAKGALIYWDGHKVINKKSFPIHKFI